MFIFQPLMIGLLPVFFLLVGYMPLEDSPIESELSIEVNNDMLLISGTVTNNSDQTKKLNYHLEVKRSGSSGTTNTSQSGSLDIEAGGDSGISSTSINAGEGDTCTVSVKVTDTDNNLVSTSNVKLTIKE